MPTEDIRIETAKFASFFRFVFLTVVATVVVGTVILTTLSVAKVGGADVAIDAWIVVLVFGLLFALPLIAVIGLVGFPIWKAILSAVSGLPPRVALAVASFCLAVISGVALVLLTGFDFDIHFGAAVDAAFLSSIGGICGTLIAWRVYGNCL